MHRFLFFILALGLFSCSGDIEGPSGPGKADFMPLEVGNKWSYHFRLYYKRPDGILKTFEGRSDWQIMSSNISGRDTSYFFTETLEAVKIDSFDFSYGHGSDTTIYSGVQYTFSVTATDSNHLAITFYPDSAGNYSPQRDLVDFTIYRPWRYAAADIDTFRYESIFEFKVYFARGIGISWARYKVIGNSQTINETTLQSFTRR